jgi:anti-anti-sigma regulatory factor
LNTSSLQIPHFDIQTSTRDRRLWIQIRGEADFSNHWNLRSELNQVELEETDSVHLDLSRLTFCDVFAFRQLLKFGTEVCATGKPVSVHGATSTIMKIAWFLNAPKEIEFVDP